MPRQFPLEAMAEFDPEVRGESLPEQGVMPVARSEMPPPVSTAPGTVKMGGVDGWPEDNVLEFAAEHPEEDEQASGTACQYRLSISSFHDRKIVKQALADYDVPVEGYDWEGADVFCTDDETVYELVKDALPKGGYKEVEPSDEQMGANLPSGNESPRSVRPSTVNQLHRNFENRTESSEADYNKMAGEHGVQFDFPQTAEEWGLFANNPGVDKAAQQLTSLVKAAVATVWTRAKYDFQKTGGKLRTVMQQEYENLQKRHLSKPGLVEFGANDTVVRENIWEVLSQFWSVYLRDRFDEDDNDKNKDVPEKDHKGLLLGASPEEELAMGVKVEMEHAATIKRIQSGELTDMKDIATAIAQDHIKEIPDYYTRLTAMEADAKAQKSEAFGERRPENQRMVDFLAQNGVKARAKYIHDGSLKHTWRLYAPGVNWTPELTAKLTELGFTDFDGNPLNQHSGNGGLFSVFVRGHDELLGEPEPEGGVAESVVVEGPGVSQKQRYNIRYGLLRKLAYKGR